MTSLTRTANKVAVKNLLLACLFLLVTVAVAAQEKTVSGTVKNPEDGSPIPNATVQVKGTKSGTITDEKGNWSLKANQNQTLVISAIGFANTEIKVGNKSVFDVVLISNNKELEGVVVTALGIKREERALGYSTSTVKGDELTNAMSGNWTDALSGKVAGLNLVRSNSGPAGSNKIILRGETNLTGSSEALIVVDGVITNQGSGRRSDIAGETVYGTGSDNMPADY